MRILILLLLSTCSYGQKMLALGSFSPTKLDPGLSVNMGTWLNKTGVTLGVTTYAVGAGLDDGRFALPITVYRSIPVNQDFQILLYAGKCIRSSYYDIGSVFAYKLLGDNGMVGAKFGITSGIGVAIYTALK